MRVSWKWLSKLVDINGLTPEEVADKLTFAGVEVDAIERVASGSNLVIGEIKECVAHPDSDHLHILKVDEGKYGIHQIVCGAPNAREGLKVIVAREGAVLPEVIIVKSTIRGVESDGMCCSLKELGVDPKYLSEQQLAGIEELPLDAPVGEDDVLGYLNLDDVVLELELLANRSDLNAMENVAKEVGALFKRKTDIPEAKASYDGSSDISISSKTDKCPSFYAIEAKGVKIGPSPKWMADFLNSSGVRSIDNVVDIGNYLMLLTGQPINMYDADKLPKKELYATIDEEEIFVSMDKKELEIKKGDLLISSSGKGMCLAGIMTSLECVVDSNSRNIVVEVASFDGASIRRTSNRLGLHSESSARFVKGINPDQSEYVLALASNLLKEYAGASTVLKCLPYDSLKHEPTEIKTSLGYINGRLGTSFELKEVLSVLEDDHMGISNVDGESFLVKVPSYRIDMKGEEDVSEEVIRLLGYDNIVGKVPAFPHRPSDGYSETQAKKKALRSFLRSNGVDEIITYSLVDSKMKDSFDYLLEGDSYKIINPLTEDHEWLRKSLLPSLLERASYNYARQNKDLAFFEISDLDSTTSKTSHLGLLLLGNERIAGSLEKREYDYYSVKGYLEGILNLFGINMNRFRLEALKSERDEFHPYRSAALYLGKKRIAVFGELHPNKIKEYDLGKSRCALLEIDLPSLYELKTNSPKAIIPPKFPAVRRDISFLISKDVAFEEIKRELLRTDKLIKNVEAFDQYLGDKLHPSKKSLAISITFLDESKTLTDDEVNRAFLEARKTLESKFGAEVRG